MNDFVNDTLAKENIIVAAQSSSKLTHIISDIIYTDAVEQNHALKTFCSITPINNVVSKILSNLLSISKKSSKQDYLSRRNISMHVYKPAECHKLLFINDAITLDSSVNLIFIAVINKPRIYYKVLCSLYLSK